MTPPGRSDNRTPERQTVTHLFRRTARWYADEEAFRQAETGNSLAYGEADTLACQFANRLRAAGIRPGDRVALLSRSRIEQAVCYFGTQLIGAIPTALHDRESTGDILEMVDDVRPTALVFQGRFADPATRIWEASEDIEAFIAISDGTGVPDFATELDEFVSDAPTAAPDVEVLPEDPSVIVFSSGTTGTPKGVVHSHRNLAWSCHLGHYFYEPRDSDLALFPLAPSFVAWQDQILTWVSVGATVVFREEFDAPAIVEILRTEPITTMTLVPTHWQRLFEAGLGEPEVDSLRVAGYSGAPISKELLSDLKETVPNAVFTAYGSTETLNAVTKLTPDRVDPETPGKVGRPIAAVDVRIVEPEASDPAAELDRGEVGEIALSGPCIATEIWENEAATDRRFSDGWWFSGDLGRIGDDGSLILEGRTDNMIVSGGINIYTERIESILGTHAGVEEVVVLGTPHDEWGEVVSAIVVPDGEVTRTDLDEWCRTHDDLGDYQRPRRYAFVNEIPKTGTGKKSRRALQNRIDDWE